MDKNISKLIDDFNDFILKNIGPSMDELKTIKSDTNRSHLQRLVYTNFVDRFDSLIDLLLIEHATNRNSGFKFKVLSKTKDVLVDKYYFFKTLLSEDIESSIKNELEDIVKNEFLRKRHSEKLRILLIDCFNFEDREINKNRVNADGRFHKSYTQSNTAKKKIPPTIIGYADWIYARRNTLVHNFGKLNLNNNDFDYIKQKFSTTPSKLVGIKLESITSLKTFYTHLIKEIETKITARGK